MLEAGIFWESRRMGNKIATNYVIGTGEEEKIFIGSEKSGRGDGNSNDTQIYLLNK